MFGSSLPSVVCRRVHALFTFGCIIVASKTYCGVTLLFLSSSFIPMLPVSLDC